METTQDRMLLINKPLEWTSFDVVNKLRQRLKIKKIGHAGTLDPLATGLLIICTGKMTKQIDLFQAEEKEYSGTMVIGQTTPSYDLETHPTAAHDIGLVTESQIRNATRQFMGMIKQIPPSHSAIKIDGKRAYELARKGKQVELKPREVEIKEFEITGIEKPCIHFRVVCSKGTYIRSLANDFGHALGVGAYLSELCRTRIGNFRLENAQTIDQVEL
jgi:tRNA pseudouridine55 synthase